MFGNNVSKAVNKTKRKFLPNLQNNSFYSEILDKMIKLRKEPLSVPNELKVTAHGVKSIEHNGGIDNFILKLKRKDHTPETLSLKKIIQNHTKTSSN